MARVWESGDAQLQSVTWKRGKSTALPGRKRTGEAVSNLLLLAGSWNEASEGSIQGHMAAPWTEPVWATAFCRVHPLPTHRIRSSCMHLSRRLTSLKGSSDPWLFSYIGFCYSPRPFSSARHHWRKLRSARRKGYRGLQGRCKMTRWPGCLIFSAWVKQCTKQSKWWLEDLKKGFSQTRHKSGKCQ